MGVQLRYFIRITLCTLVSVVMLCSCASNPDRHLYTAEEIDAFFFTERSPSSISFDATFTFAEGLARRTQMADVIVEGVIADSGTEKNYSQYDPFFEYYFPHGYATVYRLKVSQTWLGESSKTIDVVFMGKKDDYMTKPQKGDHVILFLTDYPLPDDSKRMTYLLVEDKETAYVLNPPDDTVYSFYRSNEELPYSGQSKEVLYQGIEDSFAVLANGIANGTLEEHCVSDAVKEYIKTRKENC